MEWDKDKILNYIFSKLKRAFKAGFGISVIQTSPETSAKHHLFLKIEKCSKIKKSCGYAISLNEMVSLKCDYQIKKRIDSVFNELLSNLL